MIGLVLAAGAGRRLRPHTERLPKALVPLRRDGTSVLDLTLSNFAAAGMQRVVVVVGYRAETIAARVESWESALGLRVELVHNDRAEEWNNAYSLWCARRVLSEGVVLANGDTLHPPALTSALAGLDVGDVCLAVDMRKKLGDEEMKVLIDTSGLVRAISKTLPHDADGEYIGVARIPAAAAGAVVDALARTWGRDPSAFYEAAFQLLVDEGRPLVGHPIGTAPWVEIDDEADLARAREVAAATHPVGGRERRRRSLCRS
ncbi:MAG TPA: phosphocholine cytidylyltransferase family protein [Acidimicrobiales bacterium]|nr:phosphocholine cytidylyltransferase family protein [Acidimicrobiales bacterium]